MVKRCLLWWRSNKFCRKMRHLEGKIRNGKAVVWSLLVFRRFLTLLSSQAADGQFFHYGRLVFLGGAEELLEGADELGLEVD